MNEKIDVIIQVDTQESDDTTIDNMARLLLEEIRELDVDSAKLLDSGVSQAGAKGLDPVLGTLIVTLGATVLTKILEFLHAWAMRREDQIVRIKIQVPDMTSIEVEVPQTAKTDEVKAWIQTVEQALAKQQKNKKHRR